MSMGDSIVRKTDRALNKRDDVVVCFLGAKAREDLFSTRMNE